MKKQNIVFSIQPVSKLEVLFVPLDIAKKLKKKGFNEPCIAFFGKRITASTIYLILANDIKGVTNDDLKKSEVLAPTWEQVIEWYEKHHKIIDELLYFSFTKQKWALSNESYPDRETDILSIFFESKYEARKKLIENAMSSDKSVKAKKNVHKSRKSKK